MLRLDELIVGQRTILWAQITDMREDLLLKESRDAKKEGNSAPEMQRRDRNLVAVTQNVEKTRRR